MQDSKSLHESPFRIQSSSISNSVTFSWRPNAKAQRCEAKANSLLITSLVRSRVTDFVTTKLKTWVSSGLVKCKYLVKRAILRTWKVNITETTRKKTRDVYHKLLKVRFSCLVIQSSKSDNSYLVYPGIYLSNYRKYFGFVFLQNHGAEIGIENWKIKKQKQRIFGHKIKLKTEMTWMK